MSRFIVADFVDRHAVVDTDGVEGVYLGAEGDDYTDLGPVVWSGAPFDRKNLDAQWESARAAEVECNRRNVEAPLDRKRPSSDHVTSTSNVDLGSITIEGNVLDSNTGTEA